MLDRGQAAVAEYDAFLHHYLSGAAKVAKESNITAGIVRYRLFDVVPPPLDFASLIGQVLNDLRSALNYLVIGLQQRNGLQGGGQFPIADTPDKWIKSSRADLRGLDAEDVEWIKSLQPAFMPPGSGIHVLKVLQQISNDTKHNDLVEVKANVMDVEMSMSETPISQAVIYPFEFEEDAIVSAYELARPGEPHTTGFAGKGRGFGIVMNSNEGGLTPEQAMIQSQRSHEAFQARGKSPDGRRPDGFIWDANEWAQLSDKLEAEPMLTMTLVFGSNAGVGKGLDVGHSLRLASDYIRTKVLDPQSPMRKLS